MNIFSIIFLFLALSLLSSALIAFIFELPFHTSSSFSPSVVAGSVTSSNVISPPPISKTSPPFSCSKLKSVSVDIILLYSFIVTLFFNGSNF